MRCTPRAVGAATIALGVLAGFPAPVRAQGNGNGAAADAPARPIDINTIDPATFRAIAARVPEGHEPAIDGRLEDEAWRLAPPQGHFIQREPAFGMPSTERTEFRILYDDRTLFFGIWAYDDEPDGIIASEMKRDSGLGRGDAIKIDLDTFHDHRNAFYFSTNPLGARKDANSVENGRTINYDWNAVWQSKTTRDEHGWYAEIAIPLTQLRFKGGPGDTVWGLNVCRIILRKHEESYWAPFPREWGPTGFANLTRAGVLVGLHDLRPRRRLEFVPFVAPAAARDYDAGTPTSFERRYGFDLRLGVTSTLTGNFTYKTDFAQVEADQEVVNLSRFSLYFPEKRQFFTGSAGIFDYGRTGVGFAGGENDGGPGLLALFYSRRIGLQDGREVPIIGGGKVTGRVGPYAIGLLDIETDRTAFANDGGGETRLARANYTAVRVKRNVFSRSSIGAVFLNRQGGAGSAYNRSAGVDAGFAFGDHTTLAAMFAGTMSPSSAERGRAGALDLAYKTDRFDVGGTYLDIGRHFDAEMGFIPRVDIRNSRATAAWTPRPGWRGVRQLTFGSRLDYYENHDGRLESRTEEATFKIERQDGATVTAYVDRDYDYLPFDWTFGNGTIPIGGYDWNTLRLLYGSNSGKRVYGSAEVDVGGYYSGDKQTYGVKLNVLPRDTLLVENAYTQNRIQLPGAARYVTNTLSTRVSYSFTPDLFLKGFVQYNDDRRVATLNVLFWYIYRPGSDLYVVYNNGWETDIPGARPRILRVRSRSLAVKMTWWLSR
ncbi:MAG: DUF5916 domain-containing protein [Betaproteobacteria bacterium]